MRVISLGIRAVSVLSVANKLAAPRPSSDSTCRQHVRADEGEWSGLTVDWVLKNFGLVVVVFFSSRSNDRARGAYWVFKADVLAKRMLDIVPGDSGKWNRRSLSATVRDRRRTGQFESELGKGKNRPNTTYPSSKEEEKAILNARIQIHERVKEPNWGRRSIDRLLCACMHAMRRSCGVAVHALLALSWAWVTTVSSCSSNQKMAEQRQENNKPTKRTIEVWARRSLPGMIRQTTRSRVYSFRKAIFAPACCDEHSLVLPGRSQTWKSWARRIEGRLKWLQPFLGFGERTARVCRLSSRLCMFQWEECRESTLRS